MLHILVYDFHDTFYSSKGEKLTKKRDVAYAKADKKDLKDKIKDEKKDLKQAQRDEIAEMIRNNASPRAIRQERRSNRRERRASRRAQRQRMRDARQTVKNVKRTGSPE